VSRGQPNGSPRPYSRLSRPEPLLFLPGSSSVVVTRLSEPHPGDVHVETDLSSDALG
jgi:hypothetical protein